MIVNFTKIDLCFISFLYVHILQLITSVYSVVSTQLHKLSIYSPYRGHPIGKSNNPKQTIEFSWRSKWISMLNLKKRFHRIHIWLELQEDLHCCLTSMCHLTMDNKTFCFSFQTILHDLFWISADNEYRI